MTDLAVIVPTLARQHLLPRVVEGVLRADEPVDLIFVINEKSRGAHEEIAARLRRDYGHLLSITWLAVPDEHAYPGKLNTAAAAYADRYRYLALWNDDHEALTPGWDRIAKDAIGDEPFALAYGPDGVWEEGQVPTAPILTSTLQTTLGWVVLPGLGHILADNVWLDLARWCGTAHFIPELRIQHHHLDNGEAEHDITYAETQNNEARNESDRRVYNAWYDTQRWRDGDKLRALFPGGVDYTTPARQFAPWEA